MSHSTRRRVSFVVATILAMALVIGAVSIAWAQSRVTWGRGNFSTVTAFDGIDLLFANRYRYVDNSAGQLAWGESYAMMGYVDMYQATKDRKYLDKLAEHADVLLAKRDSERGVLDYMGRALPGWTAAAHYSIGEVALLDGAGHPTLHLSVASTGHNQETRVVVREGTDPGTFDLELFNPRNNYQEAFTGLSMDPEHPRYALKVIEASPLSRPYSAVRLKAKDLASPSEPQHRAPVPVSTSMHPPNYLWPVHQGMLTYPIISYARFVYEDPQLKADPHYKAKADEFIAAVEELMEVLEDDWKENDEGEGWYAVALGAPVWMDGVDEPFNHFLAVGRTMIQLAAVTENPKWRDRAEKMARVFKNDLRIVQVVEPAPPGEESQGIVIYRESFDEPGGWTGDGDVVADAKEGTGSLLVIDDDKTRYAGAVLPPVEVKGGDTYAVSVWVKTKGSGDGGRTTMLIDERNAAGERVTFKWFDLAPSSNWQYYETTVTVDPNTAELHLTLYPAARTGVDKTATAWFDEVTVTRVPSADEVSEDRVHEAYSWPYWWSKGYGYNGWRPEDGISQNTPALQGRPTAEDVSHGSIDLHFAYLAYKDGIVFDRTDMERFANTFIYLMATRGPGGVPTFRDRVDGSDSTGTYDTSVRNWPLLAEFDPSILEWFEEMYQVTSWTGYPVQMLVSANMNLARKILEDMGVR